MINAISEIETGTVQEAPACLGCGSQRMDWTGSGWKCQECGAVERIESRKVA
jgi:tRNA(Ile2) C34 agmatinyltransferase TiaS